MLFSCTGKEAEVATLNHGVIMCHAIKMYHEKTSYQVCIIYCKMYVLFYF